MRAVLLSAAVMLCVGDVPAQDRAFVLVLKGTYTTSSELFPSPDAQDPVERASSIALNGIPGGGLEVRYIMSDLNLAVGLSAEYLAATTPRPFTGLPPSVPVEDGFRALPVELTGYFTLPFSGRSVAVHMGGGAGAYFGRRILRVGGAEAVALEESPGFGIHIVAGMSWKPFTWGSVFGDLKFRDLQFETVSVFPAPAVLVNGQPVNLPQEPLPARISTNGMVIQAGIMLFP